jgi:hypothetical protein
MGEIMISDLPSPLIVVNFRMPKFNEENGRTRFARATQRSRHPVPSLEEEPDWIMRSIPCAPAGTVVIPDIMCWDGGTEKRSNSAWITMGVGYTPLWFRVGRSENTLPHNRYESLSDRTRKFCRPIVALPK